MFFLFLKVITQSHRVSFLLEIHIILHYVLNFLSSPFYFYLPLHFSSLFFSTFFLQFFFFSCHFSILPITLLQSIPLLVYLMLFFHIIIPAIFYQIYKLIKSASYVIYCWVSLFNDHSSSLEIHLSFTPPSFLSVSLPFFLSFQFSTVQYLQLTRQNYQQCQPIIQKFIYLLNPGQQSNKTRNFFFNY